MKIEIKNRKANEYNIGEKYVAGIMLIGAEIKSVVSKECDITGSYISVVKEPLLINSYIKPLTCGSFGVEYGGQRSRKLLLTRSQINKLRDETRRGFQLIPIRLFSTTRGKIKIEFGIGKKIRKADKREKEKEKEFKRESSEI